MSPAHALPPTINTLDPIQRTRLLKSTRKLGDILGATPHVLDFPTLLPLSSNAKRQGSKLFFSQSASSSVTSLTGSIASCNSDEPCVFPPRSPPENPSESPVSFINLSLKHRRHKSNKLSRPLVLGLRSVPPLPSKSHSTSGLPALVSTVAVVPLSADSAYLNQDIMSPQLKEFDFDDVDAVDLEKQRRRRMAKLTRTLGENIPPELVFPPPPSHAAQQQFSPNATSAAERGKSKSKSKHHNKSTPQNSALMSSSTSPATNRLTHKARSLTIGSAITAAESFKLPTPKSSATSPRGVSLDEGPFTSSSSSSSPGASAKSTPRHDGWGKRREKGWSGEWNVKDADQLANALRNLKGR
ncbi:hypothetical protein AX17_003634 [Amanita inopinata Kibby_2008]|nr:hypothetical protein AX17_003634 [Amanita inopinata Kibby_2008]